MQRDRRRSPLLQNPRAASLPPRRRLCQSPAMRPANYYAAPGFERAGLKRRDMEWIRSAIADAAAQFIPVWRSQNLVVDLADVAPGAIVLTAEHATPLLAEDDPDTHLAHGRIVFLGVIDERPHFALDLSAIETPLDALASPALAASGIPSESARFADLRQLAG